MLVPFHRQHMISCLLSVTCNCVYLSSVALTLLVGRQKGHPARKKIRGMRWRWALVRMEWRPAGWSVCLPLLISACAMKSRSSLLALAHLGWSRKRAIKWLWWWCGVSQNTKVTWPWSIISHTRANLIDYSWRGWGDLISFRNSLWGLF